MEQGKENHLWPESAASPIATGVSGFNYVAKQSAGARFLALVMVLLRLRMHGTSSRLNTGTYVEKGYLLTY